MKKRRKTATQLKKEAFENEIASIEEFQESLKIGSRLTHAEFGKGKVVKKDKGMVTIDLDEPFFILGKYKKEMLAHKSEIYPEKYSKWEIQQLR